MNNDLGHVSRAFSAPSFMFQSSLLGEKYAVRTLQLIAFEKVERLVVATDAYVVRLKIQ